MAVGAALGFAVAPTRDLSRLSFTRRDHDRIRDQLNRENFGALLVFEPSEGGFWVVDTGLEAL